MELYDAMAGRLPAELITPAEPLGAYEYYTRTPFRRDLPLYCRKPINSESEEILLDLGALADQHGYAGLGAFSVSEDQRLLACTLDLSGGEEFELVVSEIASGNILSRVPSVLSVEWASGHDLVYTRLDGRGRPHAAMLHTAGTSSSSDAIVYEEDDEAAMVDVAITKGRKWITVNSNTRTSSEVRLLSAADPRSKRSSSGQGGSAASMAKLVAPREADVSYFVEELASNWLLLIANSQPPSRALGLSALHESKLPSSSRDDWVSLWQPSDESEPIEDVDVFRDHVVLYERSKGIPRVRMLNVLPHDKNASESAPRLIDNGFVALPTGDGVPCAISPAPNRQYDSSIFNFQLSSPITPPTPYLYDMSLIPGSNTILDATCPRGPPSEPPPSSDLVCKRTYATARDGVQVPLTTVHRKSIALTPETPMHLLVYGAYGACLPAEWRSDHLPLLEAGWMVVLAHVRGGGELGPEWHRAGSGLNKRTSANDLHDVIRSLHSDGVSSPQYTTAMADSAGALALGGLMNDSPSLLSGVVMRGPFLDPLNSMLDPSLPLTIEEYEEWGDPSTCSKTREAMAGYSPYDGLKRGERYPNVLLIAAEHDARVPLTQTLRYAERLRELSSTTEGEHEQEVVVHVRESGGHLGEGGRYRRFEQASLEVAWLERAVGR